MSGIAPTQSPTKSLLCRGDYPHLEMAMNPTPLLGSPLLGVQKCAGIADGITPTRKQEYKLTNTLFPMDHSIDNYQHYKEA